MKLTTRISASGFIEWRVDEIETTISKGSNQELEIMIVNLLSTIEDLENMKT